MANSRDGAWHSGEPTQTHARVKNRYGHIVFRMVYRGRCFRWTGSTYEQEYCGHNHKKKSAAAVCGERAAKRWNRLPARLPVAVQHEA